MSYHAQKDEGKQTTRNSSGGYNRRDRISFSASPNLIKNGGAGSFRVYTEAGVSFIVQTNRPVIDGSRESGFIDEVFVHGKVDPDEIVGISIPEEIRKKSIRSLSLWTELSTGSIEAFVREAAKEIEDETDVIIEAKQVDQLLLDWKEADKEDFLSQKTKDALAKINRFLVDKLADGLEQKYGIVTFEQYIAHYIGDRKPVFDLAKDHVWGVYSPSFAGGYHSGSSVKEGIGRATGGDPTTNNAIDVWFDPLKPLRDPYENGILKKGTSLIVNGQTFSFLRTDGMFLWVTDAEGKEKRLIYYNIKAVEIIQTPGGIDLNPGMLDLQTQGRGMDFNVPIDLESFDSMPIEGFSPIIFQITPTNLPLLLGDVELDQPRDQLSRVP